MRTIDRFDIYMKSSGLNDNKVTKDLSLSVGNLGKSRRPGKDLSMKNIERILNFYKNLNRVWLLTGEGEMLKSEHVAAAPAAGSDASTPPMGDEIRKLYDVIDRLTQEIWLQRKEIAEIREFLKTKL